MQKVLDRGETVELQLSRFPFSLAVQAYYVGAEFYGLALVEFVQCLVVHQNA